MHISIDYEVIALKIDDDDDDNDIMWHGTSW